MTILLKSLGLAALLIGGGIATPAFADVCTGNCGTLGANGVVTAPPAFGPNYQYVTTSGGVTGAGQIAGVAGTNGSQLITSTFSANAGDVLNFYFNYVTSDGTGQYTDYAFAELLNNSLSSAYLFTARTTPTGNTSPGFGLPPNSSTLTPGTTPINPAATNWSPLGASSGSCFQSSSSGCGNTGWIGSSYTLTSNGVYSIRFGVTNVGDTNFDSGLAFAGVTINNVQVNPITGAAPEPAAWALMIMGFGMVGFALRRRRNVATRLSYAA